MLEEKKLPVSARQEIVDNKEFGWKVKEEIDEKVGRKTEKYVLLTRDKNMMNYLTLVDLEKRYYAAKGNMKEFKPANETLTLILFICLIIPGILYLSKKKKEKKEILDNNEKMKKEMARVISEAEAYKR